ncbi:AbrB family transcriptional regulator [Microbacteriaceae bacterium K1510]|nr:AbrB family transcriptional regulator [Microbacteriaceae bacterium K1510]
MSSPPSHDFRTTLLRLAETLAIGIAGGMTLGLLGMPAGYLSGSILAVSAAALSGRPMRIPAPFARTVFVVLGLSLGAVVTPATLTGMASYPLSIAALIVGMTAVSFGGSAYLRAVHGWGPIDAYLASAPGAMSQVLVLGAELGADLRAIAIVQSTRVVIVAIGLPTGLALAGLAGPAIRPDPGPLTLHVIDELAILIVVGAFGAWLAHRLRLPGGLLFGAMITSAVLHGTGLIHAILPWWITNAAGLVLGAVIGARFTNTPLRLLMDYLGAAFGSFAVSVAIASVFAAGVVSLLSMRAAEVMIAYAPGSVDAMMLLALALHLDPVYVGAHHVVRIFLISLTAPLVARRIARKPKPPAPPREPPSFQD